MELEYLKLANSWPMWVSVLPAVALVVIQAWIFMRRAMKDGRSLGLTDEHYKKAINSSFLASLGPSVVIVIGMIALVASVGGPVAWMRLAYIGSVMYELPAADRAATAAGSTLGTPDMTMAAYANAVWVMAIGCLGWIIISILFTDKMDTLRDKVSKGNEKVLAVIAVAGGMGAFGYQTFSRALPVFTAQTWASIAAFIFIIVINAIGKKTNSNIIKQFGMTGAMIFGMLVGSFFIA